MAPVISLDNYFASGFPLKELFGKEIDIDIDKWCCPLYWRNVLSGISNQKLRITGAGITVKDRYHVWWAVYNQLPPTKAGSLKRS